MCQRGRELFHEIQALPGQPLRKGEKGYPGVADGEQLEAQHVHDPNLAQNGSVQVRPLICAGSHQEAAIGPALATGKSAVLVMQ